MASIQFLSITLKHAGMKVVEILNDVLLKIMHVVIKYE